MTPEEKERIVDALIEALVTDVVAYDRVPWESFPPGFEQEVMCLVRYEQRRRLEKCCKARKRARGLLRSFLSGEQRHQWHHRHYFYVVGSAGGLYRLCPATGRCFRVERHGRRLFAAVSYCLHEEGVEQPIPPADLSLAHMLWLRADEPLFLATANATPWVNPAWDGEYRRRLYAARQDPAEVAMRRMILEDRAA